MSADLFVKFHNDVEALKIGFAGEVHDVPDSSLRPVHLQKIFTKTLEMAQKVVGQYELVPALQDSHTEAAALASWEFDLQVKSAGSLITLAGYNLKQKARRAFEGESVKIRQTLQELKAAVQAQAGATL
ncbi:MAG: hypothetical protein K9G62_00400 [Alphaproteobacteria bacterium]|nr:hypothetical protein [Alphaproteobacteria bacterium]